MLWWAHVRVNTHTRAINAGKRPSSSCRKHPTLRHAHLSLNYAPPARKEKRGWAASGEPRWVGYIFSSYLLIQKGKKKNQSRASSFSRRKVQRNAWSSEKAGGYEIFRLGGKPAASFHFKRLSIRRCHLWRRRRTLERISDGAVMWEKRGDLLCWCSLLILNEHISPAASVQLDISTFPPPPRIPWRTLKHSFPDSREYKLPLQRRDGRLALQVSLNTHTHTKF